MNVKNIKNKYKNYSMINNSCSVSQLILKKLLKTQKPNNKGRSRNWKKKKINKILKNKVKLKQKK